MRQKLEKFFKKYYATIFIIVILLLASFLRLYRISDYLTFLGDEGRDVLVVKGIIEGFQALLQLDFARASDGLTLLGPRASAGDFFHGPIYYYFMTPFLWAFQLDPVGPAIMIALFGVATVYLVYYVGSYFFDKKAGLVASALYAVSPLVISQSRSSWNPNPMPFFSLLMLFLLYKGLIKPSWKLFLIAGILFGIAMQLHYQSIFLGVVAGLLLIIGNIYIRKKEAIKAIIIQGLQFTGGFLVGFSLFLGFELRHGFPNIRTIMEIVLFGQEGDPKIKQDYTFMGTVGDVAFRLYGRLVTRFPNLEQVNPTENLDIMLWLIATVLLAIVSIGILFKTKNKLTVIFFSIWLFGGIIILGFYKKPIYDYYLGFMFPLPFLLIGNLFSVVYNSAIYKHVGKVVALVLFFVLFIFNLDGMPFKYLPNRQKDQVKMISEFVLEKTNGKPYNFALITLGNSDHGYRYFFELAKRTPVEIKAPQVDPDRTSVTDQLLIVCEDLNCQPLGNSQWEVAGFGRAEIVDEWQVSVVKVYKLQKYQEE